MIEESLEDKKRKLKYLKQIENDILIKSNKKYSLYKSTLLCTLIGLETLFIVLVWTIGWDLVQPISWVITFLMLNGSIICYLIISEKSCNLFKILDNKKESILNNIQHQENFNKNKITELEYTIKSFEEKIS